MNTNGPYPCVILSRGIEKNTGIRSICVQKDSPESEDAGESRNITTMYRF